MKTSTLAIYSLLLHPTKQEIQSLKNEEETMDRESIPNWKLKTLILAANVCRPTIATIGNVGDELMPTLKNPVHFTFVRHGETAENRSGITQGQLNTVLCKDGTKQAKLLGKYLSELVFTQVYTSVLTRARQTTDLILQYSKNGLCPIEEDTRLQERGFGIFEGKPKTERITAAAECGVPLEEYLAPGGESLDQLRNRVSSFFEEICEFVDKGLYSKRDNILIVTHCGWLRHLLKYITSETENFALVNFEDPIGRASPNTGVTQIDVYPISNISTSQKRMIKFSTIYDDYHLKKYKSETSVVKMLRG